MAIARDAQAAETAADEVVNAVVDEGAALGVRRHFTIPGRDPFDEVEWEVRDAFIPGKDRPAFEQKHVEFPKFWSQTATNIVAQKYFRGRLSSPERETSVKQMIGRVVGTIGTWGREGRYFASEEEAETFEAELKAILVNQLAAFNSPVWFNVGFEPRPQASACFILSIDDSMESILDWIRREGIIFRGGSGSGVNLSKLRSSKEQLSKGGYASGPVSFMRGADASAGTIKSGGKCFKEGTLVATPRGWRPIERLRVGDEVLTHQGPRVVADFMPNGRKQCYRVLTREGYEVEVTAGHKFAYWNDLEGGYDVKPIEEFEPGDALYALLEPSEGGSTIPLLPPEIADPANATTTVEMQLPTELDERVAYVLGLAYGDGELRSTYPYRLRIAFCKDEAGRISADRFRKYCSELFGEKPLLLGDEEGHQQLGFTRKRLIEFLVANGLAKGKADSLEFPSVLFRALPEVRAAFVAGVIDADGTYQQRGGWSISSIDRAFLGDLQRLLLSLGVPSKIKLSRKERGNWRPLYRLCVVGHTFVERLVERIAPHSAKAQVAYEPSPGADKGWGYRPSLYRPLTARVAERGGFRVVERSVGMNDTSGYRAVATLASHPEAAVAAYAEEVSTCVQLTLESVYPTEVAETYDIEVEGVHLLSANGIYASNTRRAAKMVVLDADHPDVEEFIWCKAKEERKARVLEAAGWDMSLDSPDWASIQYQNANNSVRVSDAFMEAAAEGKEWNLTARTDGTVVDTVDARELLRQIAAAAWECADPGVQYDTTINSWHTLPNTGRINASNPCCFVGGTLVDTDEGLIRFEHLLERKVVGEPLPSVWSLSIDAEEPVLRPITNVWIAGTATRLVEVATAGGHTLRCTPEHRFLTPAGYVEAERLGEGVALVAQNEERHASDRAGIVTASRVAVSDTVTSVRTIELDEPAFVYDLEAAADHNLAVGSAGGAPTVVVHNSEYMSIDDSACNLASLNLMKFRREDGELDVEAFTHAVDTMFLAQEILVGYSSYPTPEIERNAKSYRQLGLGYTNLGALLMSRGLPYDSDEGRAYAAAVTALMTGRAYRKSAEIAARMGAFAGYQRNAAAMIGVIAKHRAAVGNIEGAHAVAGDLLRAARQSWDDALNLGEVSGYRNAQASVLAPTGTISFLMDCDTTGVEPDFSLVKSKKLVGGGELTIVNRSVPMALEKLGYAPREVEEVVAFVDERNTVIGAPYVKTEHYPVFDCAVGERAIHYMGHVKMMGAVQPFISGALSKTVNLPEQATVDEISQLLIESWQLGVKAIAIYRDNCKVAQPLSGKADPTAAALAPVAAPGAPPVAAPRRRRLPDDRTEVGRKFRVGDYEGYIHVGLFDDGTPGDIFVDIAKEGTTLAGLMNSFMISVSLGLQYGVPLEVYVSKFSHMRFEPSGQTNDPDIRIAKSIVDYIFRWMGKKFLTVDQQEEIGILSPEVRARLAQAYNALEGARVTDEAADAAPKGQTALFNNWEDAVECSRCGGRMIRAGSCYTCRDCGTSTGCG
jgi:ribonucleotide reductase alpha subunit